MAYTPSLGTTDEPAKRPSFVYGGAGAAAGSRRVGGRPRRRSYRRHERDHGDASAGESVVNFVRSSGSTGSGDRETDRGSSALTPGTAAAAAAVSLRGGSRAPARASSAWEEEAEAAAAALFQLVAQGSSSFEASSRRGGAAGSVAESRSRRRGPRGCAATGRDRAAAAGAAGDPDPGHRPDRRQRGRRTRCDRRLAAAGRNDGPAVPRLAALSDRRDGGRQDQARGDGACHDRRSGAARFAPRGDPASLGSPFTGERW